MALNIDATFEGRLICAFKNDMRNVANFHQGILKSLKIGTFIWFFYPKQKMYEPKIYSGVLYHDNEQ